jgi:cell wall-associated NlpC family hydrolase
VALPVPVTQVTSAYSCLFQERVRSQGHQPPSAGTALVGTTNEGFQPMKARPLIAAVSLTILVGGVAGAPQVSAAPQVTIAQVQAQLDALQSQAEGASEAFNQAQVELATASQQESLAQLKVAAAQKVLTSVSASTDQLAVHMYVTDGANSSMSLLMSSTPSTFLDRLAGIQQVAGTEAVTLRRAQAARLALAQTQVALEQRRAQAATAVQQMTVQRAAINDAVAQQEKVLGQLQAEERARLAQIQAQARAASAKAAAVARKAAATRFAAASRTTNSSQGQGQGQGQGGQAASSATVVGSSSASDRASIAIQYALAQVGKSYSFNAQPPNSWDCSKLTTAAWSKAGVSLTPYSYAQASEVRRISKDELQPGDLLFYFNNAHHVAMYLGGGQIVEAASPSTGVHVTSVWNSWSSAHFSYAGRPAG